MITQAEPRWSPITRWAALAGKWSITAPGAHFEGPATPGSYGLAICDARFRDGRIRAKVLFVGQDAPMKGESAGIVLGYHSESGGYLVAGLGAFDAAYSIWEFVPSAGWINRKAAGVIQNLRYDKEYQLEVIQRGQRISLLIDDVPVLEHVLPSPLPGNQLGIYAMTKSDVLPDEEGNTGTGTGTTRYTMSATPVLFTDFEVQAWAPTAFVAMQFGEPYDTIYRTVIRHEARRLGFEVIRIDEVNRPGIIFQDIQRKIEDAKVVIAEITAPNQNVYYEVGYAHALNKPTILLAQRGKELPFDIRSYRVIFYDDSIGGKPLVEKTLREHLHAILQEI